MSVTGHTPLPSPDRAPDRKALARIGQAVRTRLDADPAAWRVPVDKAEIYAVADFLDAGECARMIALVDAVACPSALYEAPGHGDYRTSWSGNVDVTDPFVRMVTRRIDDLLGIDPAWGESIQGQRYQPGQEFRGHCDWFDPTQPYWREQERRAGQRSWTAMIYLNDVEAGGVTEFPLAGVTIPPQRGTLLTWNNARPDGSGNRDTLHAALPVEAGTKHIVTRWYRTRSWS